MPKPLLTVGIPTYNRLSGLRRAVESALAQDCRDLEILIADNASTDGTEEYCRTLAKQEEVVRYIRHSVNRGPTANFNTVLRQARGDYFLFLADDDWLDPSYSWSCVAWLRAHPDCAMVGGHPRYLRDDGAAADGRPIDLPQESPARRVHAYFRNVDDGAAIYGVLPRTIFERLSDIRNVMGNDWLFVAEIAALGKVVALPEVRLYRSLGGTSASFRSLARTLELPAVQGRFPFLTIACAFATDVLWRSSVHRQALALSTRVGLAPLCAASMARRQLWLEVLGLGRWRFARRPYRIAKALYYLLNRRTGGRIALRFPGHSTVVGEPPSRTRDREP
jgi:glycosyltransferase involved in cell wall biosynthesis